MLTASWVTWGGRRGRPSWVRPAGARGPSIFPGPVLQAMRCVELDELLGETATGLVPHSCILPLWARQVVVALTPLGLATTWQTRSPCLSYSCWAQGPTTCLAHSGRSQLCGISSVADCNLHTPPLGCQAMLNRVLFALQIFC